MNKRYELIRAIVVLPGTVLVIVPAALIYFTRSYGFLWGIEFPEALVILIAAAVFLLAGIWLAIKTMLLFFTVGDGTPAPWAPPKNFVVGGPYRHVRNPMLSGVLCILAGEALLTGSPAIAIYLVLFWLGNTIYFIFFEEPALARRFGEDYLEYKRHVRRWVPSIRPWRGLGF